MCAVSCVALHLCAEGSRLTTYHLSQPLNQDFGIPFLETPSRQWAIGSRRSADAIASYPWFQARHDIDENCALLGCYAASNVNFLPTLWDLSVTSLRAKDQTNKFLTDVTGRPTGPISKGHESKLIPYRRFGTTYHSHLQSYNTQEVNFLPTFRDKLLVTSSGLKNPTS
jgi:hypothetical protein